MRIKLPGVSSLLLLLVLSSCELLEDMESPISPEPCEEAYEESILICAMPEYFNHVPRYPGGQEQMLQFIAEHVEWPKGLGNSCVEGIVVVKILVGKSGKLSSAEIVKSLHPAFDAIGLQVAQKMPNWIPGTTKEGVPVTMEMYLPIRFRLQ